MMNHDSRHIGIFAIILAVSLITYGLAGTDTSEAQGNNKTAFFPNSIAYCYGHRQVGLNVVLADTIVSINNIRVFPPLTRHIKITPAMEARSELINRAVASVRNADSDSARRDVLMKEFISSTLVDSVTIAGNGEYLLVWWREDDKPLKVVVPKQMPSRDTELVLERKRKIARTIFQRIVSHLEAGEIVLVASSGGAYFLSARHEPLIEETMRLTKEQLAPQNWDYSSPIPLPAAEQLVDPLPLDRY